MKKKKFLGLLVGKQIKKKIINVGEKKKQEAWLEWATAHFSNLSHDTMDCIVTLGSWAQLQGPRHGQDSATIRPSMCHNTVEHVPRYGRDKPRHGRPARKGKQLARARASSLRAHGLGVGCVAIQAATRRSAARARARRHGTASDTAGRALRHGHNTTPGAP